MERKSKQATQKETFKQSEYMMTEEPDNTELIKVTEDGQHWRCMNTIVVTYKMGWQEEKVLNAYCINLL